MKYSSIYQILNNNNKNNNLQKNIYKNFKYLRFFSKNNLLSSSNNNWNEIYKIIIINK